MTYYLKLDTDNRITEISTDRISDFEAEIDLKNMDFTRTYYFENGEVVEK